MRYQIGQYIKLTRKKYSLVLKIINIRSELFSYYSEVISVSGETSYHKVGDRSWWALSRNNKILTKEEAIIEEL